VRAKHRMFLALNDKISEKRCDRCRHYWFIDSGYGECHYLPPVLVRAKLFPLQYETMYPHVGWCDPACSKFLPFQQGGAR